MIAVCPRCDVALVVLSWNGMDVDVCPSCRGIWLDQGELEELLVLTGARADDPLLAFQQAKGCPSRSPRAHLCPRCDTRLKEVNACRTPSGDPLHVDRCPRGHGLWFDRDELRLLLESFPPECGVSRTVAALGDLLGAGTQSC